MLCEKICAPPTLGRNEGVNNAIFMINYFLKLKGNIGSFVEDCLTRTKPCEEESPRNSKYFLILFKPSLYGECTGNLSIYPIILNDDLLK